MSLKYAQIPAEDVVFREQFINDTYVADNGVTLTGAPTIDNGITLNGSSQLGETPFSFDNLDAFSIEVVFTPGTVGGTWHPFIVQGLQAASGVMFAQNANKLMFLLPNASYETLVADDVLLQVGQTYHAVATFDGTNGLIYVNGNLDTATRAFTKGSSGGDKTTIGASVSGGIYGSWATLYYQGTIHELNVYDRVLTKEEVADRLTQQTFREPTPENSEIWLPLRTHYYDGANEVTPNLGNVSEDIIEWGDGSTSSTFPTLLENNGASFDGGDYVNVDAANADPFNIDTTTNVSMFALINRNTLGNNAIMTKGITSLNTADGWWFVFTGDVLQLWFNDFNTTELNATAITYDTNILPGSYHTVGVVIDRTGEDKACLYFDGVQVNSASLSTRPGTWSNNNIPFRIGTIDAGVTYGYDGKMKFPVFTKQALTPTQMKWLHDYSLRNLNI